jgi:hypothetical protein
MQKDTGFAFCAKRKEENAYRTLSRWLEGRGQLRTPSRKWKDNIKMHLNRKGWESVDWINPALDRIRWRAEENRNEILKSRNSGVYNTQIIY